MGNCIHPSSIVDPECELGEGVEIGPNCVLRGRVRLGNGTKLIASVQMAGPVEIGDHCTFYPFACVGFPPQDFKFKLGDATAGVHIARTRSSASTPPSTPPARPTFPPSSARRSS